MDENSECLFSKIIMILSKDFELHTCPLNPTACCMVNDLPYISTQACEGTVPFIVMKSLFHIHSSAQE